MNAFSHKYEVRSRAQSPPKLAITQLHQLKSSKGRKISFDFPLPTRSTRPKLGQFYELQKMPKQSKYFEDDEIIVRSLIGKMMEHAVLPRYRSRGKA